MTPEEKRHANEKVAQWKKQLLEELTAVRHEADEARKRLELYRAYARDLEQTVARLKGLETP